MDPQSKPCFVTIQKRTTTRDPNTNEIHTGWELHRQCWVGIMPNYAKEREDGGSRESSVTHTARGHYEEWKDVLASMRFTYDSLSFDIVGVKLDFTHRQDAVITARQTDEPV